MSHLAVNSNIPQIILSQSVPAASGEQASALSMIMEVIKEAKEWGILPPHSMADDRFLGQVAKFIKNGDLKLVVSRQTKGNIFVGKYVPQDKTIELYIDKNATAQELGIEAKSTLLHELYHAYQHLGKKLPATRSAVEGPALLLSIKYLCKQLGIKAATPEDVIKLLKYGAVNDSWFLTVDDEALSQLIRGALTKDRGKWEGTGKKIGAFYLRFTLYNNLAPQMLGSGPLILRQPKISYELGPGIAIIISNQGINGMADRNKRAKQTGTKGNLREYHDALVAIMDYWQSICAKQAAQIAAYDRTLP